MFYNYYEDYQYDSCVSKGICSIGPRTSSLQEALIMYLKLLAFYTIELKNFGGHNKDAEQLILDIIATLMSNLETANKQFEKMLVGIKTLITESKKTYIKLCKSKNIEPKYIQSTIKLDENLDITKIIQQGEREYAKRLEYLSPERKNLFEVMAHIIKSLSINVVSIQSYSKNDALEKEGFEKILILLNFLNYQDTNTDDILEEIKSSAVVDYKLFRRIAELKIQRYGEPESVEVSLSTRPGKAILVAGTSLRELEEVLEQTKDKNIDVYTHGEMLVAHTYPKFKQYEHLRGHYGVGVENCLLDFATFPGAILITKYAIENIEYLYRGRLFTTDYFVPKGAVKIKNNDYSPLIESAQKAKGFKRGKEKENIIVGLSKTHIDREFEKLINSTNKFKHIVILGPESYNKDNRLYYKNILKNMSKDVFVISFSERENCDNMICLNGTTNFEIIYYILDKISSSSKLKNLDISIFISKCDKHTISNIISLKEKGIKNIFLSKCTPIMLNPTLTSIISKHYNILPAEHPLDDLKIITDL